MPIRSLEPAACGVVCSICTDICPIATESIPFVSILRMAYVHMYHFAWVDQREKQGYKSNVSLKRGIKLVKGVHIITT